MNRLAKLIFFGLVILIMNSLSVLGEEKTDIEIQAYLNSVAGRFNNGDIDGLVKTVYPGTVFKYIDGRILTIEKLSENLKTYVKGCKSYKISFNLDSVKRNGKESVIEYTETDRIVRNEKGNIKEDIILSRWRATVEKTQSGWLGKDYLQLSKSRIPSHIAK